jgi:isochorismate synthase EntC
LLKRGFEAWKLGKWCFEEKMNWQAVVPNRCKLVGRKGLKARFYAGCGFVSGSRAVEDPK